MVIKQSSPVTAAEIRRSTGKLFYAASKIYLFLFDISF
jgi:hypothetical protein